MKIFLDTNIFHDDWFMKNANFKYLFHFLNNEEYELLISSLVIEEVENNQKKEFSLIKSELKKNIKSLNILTQDNFQYDASILENNQYNLRALLEEHINNITIIDYNVLPHTEIVNRALQNTKPFMPGEKGYRDTLIWLSLLEYLNQSENTEDIKFITANKSDFFKSKKTPISFHQDLVNDISTKNITCSIEPFNSLYSFIDSTVDKQEHAIDYNAGDISWYLEHEGITSLELLPDNEIIKHLSNSPHNDLLENDFLSIESINFEVMEGLEDEKITFVKELSNNEVYVQYDYNLRIVVVEVEIGIMEYLLNKNEFDNKFYNLIEEENSVFISFFPRIYYTSSLVYNSETREVSNYEIDELAFI